MSEPGERQGPIKQAEPDDPMDLRAEATAGDPTFMIDSIVEEYARIGWDAGRILRLFEEPFFQATYGLGRAAGVEAVQRRVHAVLARCGTMRVTVTHADAAGDGVVPADRLRARRPR